MRLFVKLIFGLCRQFHGLLSLLPLVTAAVLLVILLGGSADLAASEVFFQSPAATPTPTLAPTNTPLPAPTNTMPPAPTNTPQPDPTATPPPTDTPAAALPVTDTPPAATPLSTAVPLAETPTSGAIQMPLLPPTATPESLLPTPSPTPASKPLLSPNFVGWVVVIVILALTAIVGLLSGGVLSNLTRS